MPIIALMCNVLRLVIKYYNDKQERMKGEDENEFGSKKTDREKTPRRIPDQDYSACSCFGSILFLIVNDIFLFYINR